MKKKKLIAKLDSKVTKGKFDNEGEQFIYKVTKKTDTVAIPSSFASKFLGAVKSLKRVKYKGTDLKKDTSFSKFTFKFDLNNKSKLTWKDTIIRKWKKGAVIEESFMSETVSEKPKKKASKPAKQKNSESTAELVNATTSKTKTIKKADITIIEGIGPALKKMLTEGGLGTFEKLAVASPEEISKLLLEKGGTRTNVHNPTNWPLQAKLAAEEKWEELENLKSTLIRGR